MSSLTLVSLCFRVAAHYHCVGSSEEENSFVAVAPARVCVFLVEHLIDIQEALHHKCSQYFIKPKGGGKKSKHIRADLENA